MFETRWMESDWPGVYLNAGAQWRQVDETNWLIIVGVFAVAWFIAWGWLMLVTTLFPHDRTDPRSGRVSGSEGQEPSQL